MIYEESQKRKIVFYSISEQVYSFLEEDILSGKYAPGSRIDLDVIEKTFGISRIPIRDALERLIANGLVRKVARVGYFLINPTAAELRDLFGVRRMMEEYALSLGLASIDKEFVAELRSRFVGFTDHSVFSDKDKSELLRLDMTLHRDVIIGNSGSPLLNDIYEGIRAKVNLVSLLSYRLCEDIQEHISILNTILNGDLAASISNLRTHLAASEENTIRYQIEKEAS